MQQCTQKFTNTTLPRKMQMACIYTHQSPAISGGRNVPQKNRHRSVALCKKLSCSRISENVRESVGTSSSSSSRMVTDISIKRDLGKGTDNNRRRLTSTTTSSLLLGLFPLRLEVFQLRLGARRLHDGFSREFGPSRMNARMKRMNRTIRTILFVRDRESPVASRSARASHAFIAFMAFAAADARRRR